MSRQRPDKIRIIIAYLASTLLAFTFASVSHTYFVLEGLQNIGTEIDRHQQWLFILNDWLGLAPTYGAIIALGFAAAFPTMLKFNRWLSLPPILLFSLGGLLALLTIHLLMYPIMHITLIAGARSETGFVFQLIAGALGGVCFGFLWRWIKIKK